MPSVTAGLSTTYEAVVVGAFVVVEDVDGDEDDDVEGVESEVEPLLDESELVLEVVEESFFASDAGEELVAVDRESLR